MTEAGNRFPGSAGIATGRLVIVWNVAMAPLTPPHLYYVHCIMDLFSSSASYNYYSYLLLTLRMQPGQQAYQRYRYAEPAGRLYVRATGSRLLCRGGTRGGYWALYAASG